MFMAPVKSALLCCHSRSWRRFLSSSAGNGFSEKKSLSCWLCVTQETEPVTSKYKAVLHLFYCTPNAQGLIWLVKCCKIHISVSKQVNCMNNSSILIFLATVWDETLSQHQQFFHTQRIFCSRVSGDTTCLKIRAFYVRLTSIKC